MTNIIVTIGKDVAAYAEVRVPQGTELDNATLREMAYEADRNEVFTPNWENSSGLRIVCVSGSENSDDNDLCDIQIESGRLDLGMEAELFLKGVISLDQFVSNAIGLRTIKEEEVNLQPIEVYAEVFGGAISSVKTTSKHFAGNIVQIDHDCEQDADYEIDGMKVSVYRHTVDKAVGGMNLLPIEGTIEHMVAKLNSDVHENGLVQVLEHLEDWELSSEDDDESIIVETCLLDKYDNNEISFVVTLDRDQLTRQEIMASVTVIKVNHSDENGREVLFEESACLTNLINKLIEQEII